MLCPPQPEARLETRLFGVRRLAAALPVPSLLGMRVENLRRQEAPGGIYPDQVRSPAFSLELFSC
jgi:hypothetical protein